MVEGLRTIFGCPRQAYIIWGGGGVEDTVGIKEK